MFSFAVTSILILIVQEVYNRDRSPEVNDVEGLAVAAIKHLELLKQKDKAEGSFIIENIVENTRPFPLIDSLQDSNGCESCLHSHPQKTKPYKFPPKMFNLCLAMICLIYFEMSKILQVIFSGGLVWNITSQDEGSRGVVNFLQIASA